MDDKLNPDDIEEGPTEEAPQPKPLKIPTDVPMVPVTKMKKGKEPWKQGSGCGGRIAAYGCAVGVLVLIGILMAGASMLRKGVWTTMEKGRRAVVRSLPLDMPEAERREVALNLDRFRRVLEELDDPYPVMGQFMKRVRVGLADGRLTREEAEEINLFLEQVIEESGIPPLQLGFRIFQPARNSGLGSSACVSLPGQPISRLEAV